MNIEKRRTLLIEGSKFNMFLLLPIIIIGAFILVHDQAYIADASNIHDLIKQADSTPVPYDGHMALDPNVADNCWSEILPVSLSSVEMKAINGEKSRKEHSFCSTLSPPSENKTAPVLPASCLVFIPLHVGFHHYFNSLKVQQSVIEPSSDSQNRMYTFKMK